MNITPKLSICIPTYEMKGNGVLYLKQQFQTIQKQSFKDFEIIISDHSQNNDIRNLCISFKDLNIKHYFNEIKRGSSSNNINNAINKSNSNIIKPMFQDDFFVNERALELIYSNLTNSHNVWLATTYTKYNNEFYGQYTPFYNKDIIKGNNTIGAPSVICFKRDSNELFDENLIWFMDCEFYYKLYKHSEPIILNDILIANRIWPGQVTNTLITQDLIQYETNHIRNKYNFQ